MALSFVKLPNEFSLPIPPSSHLPDNKKKNKTKKNKAFPMWEMKEQNRYKKEVTLSDDPLVFLLTLLL